MRRALHLTAGALLLLAVGCGKSSTEPNRTLSYTGTIKANAPVESSLTLNSVGNARATLLSLQQLDATGTPVVPPTVGFDMSIGPQSTPCAATGSFLFLPGRSLSLGLDKGTYCLRFSETGVLPADGSLQYEMQIEVTD